MKTNLATHAAYKGATFVIHNILFSSHKCVITALNTCTINIWFHHGHSMIHFYRYNYQVQHWTTLLLTKAAVRSDFVKWATRIQIHCFFAREKHSHYFTCIKLLHTRPCRFNFTFLSCPKFRDKNINVWPAIKWIINRNCFYSYGQLNAEWSHESYLWYIPVNRLKCISHPISQVSALSV